MQRQAYANVVEQAINTGAILNGAISATANAKYWTTAFPTTTLGSQLQMVARLDPGRAGAGDEAPDLLLPDRRL